MSDYSLIHDASELRKLIAENPDLPIVVLADEESACSEWSWTFCSSVHCRIAKILDVQTPYDDEDGHVFTDEDDFEEAIIDKFSFDGQHDHLPEKEFFEVVKAEVEKYKDEWKTVIAVYASN